MKYPIIQLRILICCAVYLSLCAPVVADGLPGEYLLSARWRELLSAHSPLANPSFIAREQFLTCRGAFAGTMQGAFKLWEAGLTIPLGLWSTAGLSVLGENDGYIDNSTFDETANRLVPGTTELGNNNLFFMMTYAHTLFGRMSAGANLNIAYQTNFHTPVAGIGLDVGCSYRILESEQMGNHTIGLSTVNLIAPSMGGSLALKFGNQGEYARDLRLSWIGDFWDERVDGGLDIDLKDFLGQAREFQSRGEKKLEWGGALRVGGWAWHILRGYFQAGFDERFIEYWGLAGGMKLPLGKNGRSVTALYQYNIKTEGDLASSHTLYLIANFGKSRGDLFSRPVGVAQSSWIQRHEQRKEAEKKPSLDELKKIQGLVVEEEEQLVRITAEEIAVHFASGSADLPKEALSALKEIAAFLRSYPDHPVTIEGHTDSDPIVGRLKEKYPDNTALSRERAENVKRYFVVWEQLPEKLFTITGFGESKPLAPNTTPEQKYKNRRVVITIMK